MRAFRVASILLLVALIAAAPTATAHAWLLEAHPGPNQQVPTSPDVVFLKFTEKVQRDHTRAEVYDLNGTRRDAGSVVFTDKGDEIIVPVRPLEDAVYTVKWFTLSVDTHTASGSYVFAVGSASLEGAPLPSSSHVHGGGWVNPRLEAAARAFQYAGLAFALGFALFHLVIARPVMAARSARGLVLGARVASVAAALGVAGGLLLLIAFSQRLDTPLGPAAATNTGRYLVFRMVGGAAAAAALAVFGFRTPQADRARRLVLAGALLAASFALLSTSFSSHAAALSEDRAFALTADAVHLFAGSAWAGGLLALVFLVPSLDAYDAGRLVYRFSPLAMLSVGAILGTGAFASLLHMRAVEELWTTDYGRALLVKILLMGPLLFLGAFNRYWLGPRFRAGRAPRAYLHRSVILETLLVVGVFTAAGVLATTAPPSVQLQGVASNTLVLEKPLEKAHLQFQINPNPPRVGIQNFTVSLHAYDNRPNPPGTDVSIKFAAPGQPEPQGLTSMNRTTSDDWTLRGAYLTERGNWTIYVIVQRPDEYAKVPFVVDVR